MLMRRVSSSRSMRVQLLGLRPRRGLQIPARMGAMTCSRSVRSAAMVRLVVVGLSSCWVWWDGGALGRSSGRGTPMGAVSSSLYEDYRYPGEIISHCVWLYRFPLSSVRLRRDAGAGGHRQLRGDPGVV
jgi:hypothetical protein